MDIEDYSAIDFQQNILLVLYGWGLGLWCLAPLSTIFHWLYRGGQFYWLKETTGLPQGSDKQHFMLYELLTFTVNYIYHTFALYVYYSAHLLLKQNRHKPNQELVISVYCLNVDIHDVF